MTSQDEPNKNDGDVGPAVVAGSDAAAPPPAFEPEGRSVRSSLRDTRSRLQGLMEAFDEA